MDRDARTIKSRLTVESFRKEKSECKSDSAVLKYIKTTINTLITFYDVTRAHLMVRYSKAGVGSFPPTVVFRQYELLMRRIERGELVLGGYSSVLDAVKKQAHVFRNGRLSAAAKRLASEMTVEIEGMIRSCRQKAMNRQAADKIASRKDRKVDPKLGAKVIFSGDRWDIAGWHLGVIVKAGKMPQRRTYGYQVRFVEDGVLEWFSLKELEEHFVTGSVTAADAPDDIDMRLGDRVYCAWQDTDQWYYGSVIDLKEMDCVTTIDVQFDDGTCECGITQDRSQFISRPDVLIEVNDDDTDTHGNEEDKLIKVLTVGDNTMLIDDTEADELWEL